MSTKPTNDVASIALDARRVLEAAREDAHDAEFRKRIGRHELDAFAQDLDALEAGDGARTTRLHAKVAAGAHVAEARASILHVASDVRDDVKLSFPEDAALQHAFGVGLSASASSTAEMRHLGHTLLDAASAHPEAAAKVGLDAHGVRDLEQLLEALDGADHAHVLATTARHDNSTATDSLAHKVAHEAAHLRLVARRVFKRDPSKLDRYKCTLPRRAVVHRAPKGAAAPGG